MTLLATPLPPRRPSTAARPPAHAAAERRRTFDLRRGQADDDVVADFDVAVDDFGVAAVADAGAHLHGRELLGGLVEQVDGLRPRPRRLARGLAERARRAAEPTAAAPELPRPAEAAAALRHALAVAAPALLALLVGHARGRAAGRRRRCAGARGCAARAAVAGHASAAARRPRRARRLLGRLEPQRRA